MSDVHDNISSLIAAYAIGAVPEDEVAPIRAHILTCEECFAEAESFAEVAAAMAELVEPVPLPEGFEETILTKVRAERPETSAPRERRWWRARRPLIAGAAAVLVGVLGFTTVSYVGSRARQRQYQETVAALVHDPDAFTLTGAGGAEAVLASTSTGSVLVAVDLGEAPAGRDYQLWLMKDGTPSSAGTFDVSDSVVIIEYDDPISGYDGAAVTVEPDGGSDAPTTDPVLSS